MRKALMSAAARSAAFARIVRLLEHADAGRSYLLPVLTYHRVAQPEATPHLFPGLISATPREFADQIRFLAKRYRVLPMEAVLEAQIHKRLPRHSLIITFDDAYADFGEHAWPVLRRHDLPVTVFVPTGYPGSPHRSFWWDRLYATLASADGPIIDTPIGRLSLADDADRDRAFELLRRDLKRRRHADAEAIVDQLAAGAPAAAAPGVMSWTDLRRLAEEGVTLAPHTRNHAILSQVSAVEIDVELRSSREDLNREIGPTLPVFAYPSGEHSPAAVAGLHRLGFRAAFTTERGVNDVRRADWLRLRRLNVGRRSTLPIIRAQLLSRPLRAPTATEH